MPYQWQFCKKPFSLKKQTNPHTPVLYWKGLVFRLLNLDLFILFPVKRAHGTRKITLEYFVLALLIEEIPEYQNAIKEIQFFPVVCKNATFTGLKKKLDFTFSLILDNCEIFFKCLYFISILKKYHCLAHSYSFY